MCELFGASSGTPRRLTRWLLPFRARGGGTADNPDGWGVAYWAQGQPEIAKSPQPGCSSAPFLRLAETLDSALMIAHVRKARHPPVPSLANTHPFVHACCGRDWVFAHNGLVAEVVDRTMANSTCQPRGATDSEHAFCQLLAGIAGSYIGDGPRHWLDALNRLADAIASLGKFNFLLSDGRILIAYGHDRLHYLESSDGHDRYALVATELLADGAWQPFSARELRVYQDGALLASQVGLSDGGAA